jgi:hypothetical protein
MSLLISSCQIGALRGRFGIARGCRKFGSPHPLMYEIDTYARMQGQQELLTILRWLRSVLVYGSLAALRFPRIRVSQFSNQVITISLKGDLLCVLWLHSESLVVYSSGHRNY